MNKIYDPNLNYQYYGGVKGGSDSRNKLASIKLPDLRGKRFLDLGCNAGFFCEYAKNSGASYVLGVDNSTKVIELARKRNPDIKFLDEGWENFPEGKFDVVICLSAIHYASNQMQLVKNIHDHLNIGGLFVLEGGLINEKIVEWSDLPVVSFREVGDRVRHLSIGFLRRHLLLEFDWNVIGSSIMQGGDPIPRSVIHAYKNRDVPTENYNNNFRLCPIEYARALAVCASTIQENQPSCSYIKALGSFGTFPSREHISNVLSDPQALSLFADDIVYALKGYGTNLELSDGLGPDVTFRLSALLQEQHIKASIAATAGTNAYPVMRRMQAGVELSDGTSFERVLEQCDFSGTKVADFSGAKSMLWRRLLDKSVRECHIHVANHITISDARIKRHAEKLWHVEENEFDYIFFDSTDNEDFDHVDDTSLLAKNLKRLLAPRGQAFLVLRTGMVQTDWDVFNSILLTPIGRLPSSEYLYNVLLQDFAVRPLIRLDDKKNKNYCVTRIFRVTPRQPTLMLILGHSQAGKTTLARKVRYIPDAIHLSSDYLFYELFRLRSNDILPNCTRDLLDIVGGGSAEEVGNFFRTIESDPKLFRDYLELVISMIPREKSVVSLDLDLRQNKRIDELKDFFTKAGFSVWIVTR